MILVDTIYINDSGGKVLLEYLIKGIIERNSLANYFILFDKRLDSKYLQIIPKEQFKTLDAGEIVRRNAFVETLRTHKISKVFSFNNLPPPVRLQIPVYIYFQNVLLLNSKEFNLSFKSNILFRIKSLYSRYLNIESYIWIVQTELIKESLSEKYRIKAKNIKVLPFFELKGTKNHLPKEDIFIYVAHGFPHKNHFILLRAWETLAAKYKLFPTLYLTINPIEYIDLNENINKINQKGIKIKNLGLLSKTEINALYSKAQYLVYPSLR